MKSTEQLPTFYAIMIFARTKRILYLVSGQLEYECNVYRHYNDAL